LVQRYLRSPYLIDGKKFDLRIYVLVSGVDPLRVYVHDEVPVFYSSPYSDHDMLAGIDENIHVAIFT
jgi:hypothetical protein